MSHELFAFACSDKIQKIHVINEILMNTYYIVTDYCDL